MVSTETLLDPLRKEIEAYFSAHPPIEDMDFWWRIKYIITGQYLTDLAELRLLLMKLEYQLTNL